MRSRNVLPALFAVLVLGCGEEAAVEEAAPAPPRPRPPVCAAPFKMRIADVYAGIGRPRKTFDPAISGLPPGPTAYLEQLVQLVDLAVLGRAQCLCWFDSNQRFGLTHKKYDSEAARVIQQLEMLPPPPGLEETHEHVVAAVRHQRKFFASWYRYRMQRRGQVLHQEDPDLLASSERLEQAVRSLDRALPDMPGVVWDAVRSRLVALDFWGQLPEAGAP